MRKSLQFRVGVRKKIMLGHEGTLMAESYDCRPWILRILMIWLSIENSYLFTTWQLFLLSIPLSKRKRVSGESKAWIFNSEHIKISVRGMDQNLQPPILQVVLICQVAVVMDHREWWLRAVVWNQTEMTLSSCSFFKLHDLQMVKLLFIHFQFLHL